MASVVWLSLVPRTAAWKGEGQAGSKAAARRDAKLSRYGWRRMIAPGRGLCYQSPRMFLLDLMGIVLTLITLGFLALAGYLTALRLLGEEAERDALALTIAALLAATAEAVGIALLLGALGVLRLDL